MPHLKYCNRYWYIAGDELSVPALCSISARTAWTVLISIVTAITFTNLDGCDAGWVLQVYLLLSILLFVLSVVVDGLIINASLKGSIIESDKRGNMGNYLTMKVALTLVQLVCAAFGLAGIFLGSSADCNQDNYDYTMSRIFVGIVAISQVIDSTVLFCCCYCFQASYSKEDHLSPEQIELRDEHSIIQLWESRCQMMTRYIHLLCCNLFGGGNIEEGFDQVAKVLTTFFHHDGFLDVVASDVVAGFILVRVEQRYHLKQVQHKFKEQSLHLTIPSPRNPKAFSISKFPSQEQLLVTNQPFDTNLGRSSSAQNLAEQGLAGEATQHPEHHGDPLVYDHQIEVESLHQGYTLVEIDNWFRCSVFSLAMYTHLLALYMHPLTGICRITCCECMINPCIEGATSSCLPSSSKSSASSGHSFSRLRTNRSMLSIEGDNCCRLNFFGMKVLTKDLNNTDLVYVSYKNDTRNKPYGIFLDHEKEWIVIAVRGTLSLEDCITDAICEPTEMTEAGKVWGFDGRGRWAHGGFLRAAMHIRSEIENNKILQRILSNNIHGVNGNNMKTPLTETFNCSHYKLIVTGHSLGAGTAIILAWLLRSAYPTLHCYSYGTPGSVVDEASCVEISTFVTSIVLGNDLVSRLNFPSLCRLRNDVLDAISRARVNKMFVLRAIFKDLEPNDLMYPRGEEPDSEFKRSVEKFKDNINRKLADKHSVQLSIPGKVVHFVKVKRDSRWCSNHPHYFPINSSFHDFREIVVSSTMGADHLPDQYYYETRKIRDYFLRSGYNV